MGRETLNHARLESREACRRTVAAAAARASLHVCGEPGAVPVRARGRYADGADH